MTTPTLFASRPLPLPGMRARLCAEMGMARGIKAARAASPAAAGSASILSTRRAIGAQRAMRALGHADSRLPGRGGA